ncbi:MAG TPA: hypothetical protein PLR41_06470 [Alphaproteobacteria bacterium]|nr:hypothetical protein [Alphaproteobacteria bacterium]
MFKRKTLFIVGAGAGYDIRMPIGTKLAEVVANKVHIELDDFDRPTSAESARILQYATNGDHSKDQIMVDAGRIIRGGIQLTNSIDDFLHLHQHNSAVVRMGKVAIVKAILEAEKGSRLWIDPSNKYNTLNLTDLSPTWYVQFMRLLCKGVPLKDVESIFKNVSFITFNYDRCIEHFLINALTPLYNITSDKARRLCENINVLHPYGTVGPLPGWRGKGNFVDFGSNKADIGQLADSIRTYTETTDDTAELNAIKQTVGESEVIVFLGFGFHQPNMQMLNPARESSAQVFAMAYGYSENLCKLTCRDIGEHLGMRGRASVPGGIHIRSDLDCPKFFQEFGRQIAS